MIKLQNDCAFYFFRYKSIHYLPDNIIFNCLFRRVICKDVAEIQQKVVYLHRFCPCSLMDRMKDSGSFDMGSIPVGGTM